MNQMPTVHVLMNAYNTDQYVEQALSSLITQTYPNWRLTLLENGSTDNTRKIVRAIADKEPRISLTCIDWNNIIYPGKSDPPSIFERIKDAKDNDYFATLDSDDYFATDALEIMVNAAVQHNADEVITGCGMFKDGSSNVTYRLPPDGVYEDISEIGKVFIPIYGSIRSAWSKLFKISIIRHIFYEHEKTMKAIQNGNDTMMNLLALDLAQNAVSVAKPTVFYRIRQGSIYHSNIYPDRYKSYNILYDKSKELLTKWGALSQENFGFLEAVRFSSMEDTVLFASKAKEPSDGLKLIQNILSDESFQMGLRRTGRTTEFMEIMISCFNQNLIDRLTADLLNGFLEFFLGKCSEIKRRGDQTLTSAYFSTLLKSLHMVQISQLTFFEKMRILQEITSTPIMQELFHGNIIPSDELDKNFRNAFPVWLLAQGECRKSDGATIAAEILTVTNPDLRQVTSLDGLSYIIMKMPEMVDNLIKNEFDRILERIRVWFKKHDSDTPILTRLEIVALQGLNKPNNEIMAFFLDIKKKRPESSKELDVDAQICNIAAKYPVLQGLGISLIITFSQSVCHVIKGDIHKATDVFLSKQNVEISDEDAESYAIFGQNLCAATEYTDGWLFFKKLQIRVLLDRHSCDEAKLLLDELEDVLSDDTEAKELRKELNAMQ